MKMTIGFVETLTPRVEKPEELDPVWRMMAEFEGNEPSEGAGRVIRDRQTLHYPRWILTKRRDRVCPREEFALRRASRITINPGGFERRH